MKQNYSDRSQRFSNITGASGLLGGVAAASALRRMGKTKGENK